MPERRLRPDEVTPSYEDQGIFKGQLVRIWVELVPLFGRNTRDDIMIKGFVVGDGAIDVVFPGRRKKQAKALQTEIMALWSKAGVAARNRGVSLMVDDVRYRVQVEGSWRPRFFRDDQGWETRKNQLYAARWAIVDQNGESKTYGEPVTR